MAERWYNSKLAEGAAVVLACLGIGSCCYLQNTSRYEQKTPEVQEIKVDGHNIKFYSLEKHMAVTEVDKEPILEFIKKH